MARYHLPIIEVACSTDVAGWVTLITKRTILLTISLVVALCAATVIALFVVNRETNQTNISDSLENAPSLIDNRTLDQLAATSTPIDRSHLANGLIPPTNKWFSGFALQADPKPAFSYPNSFKPTADGFEFSLPKVTSTSTSIAGPHAPDVVVTIQGAAQYKITRYDELTVDLTYYDKAQEVAVVTVGSGLPYIYVGAKTNSVNLKFSGQTRTRQDSTQILSNQAIYGVNRQTDTDTIRLQQGEYATFFSSPDSSSYDEIASHADTVVESAAITYERHDSSIETSYRFTTRDDKPTIFALLPHQQQTTTESPTVYRSILGDLRTESGTTFSYEVPLVETVGSLDLSKLSDEQRSAIKQQLVRDVSSLDPPKTDTYFGGKQLYRTAQLLDIAEQLDDQDSATKAKANLREWLEKWLSFGSRDKRSFLYDESMKGIVGNEASFGSDKQFNDHHFHYGYFIHAAAILSKYDEQFQQKYHDSVNLLIADIANYNSEEPLPPRRNYDAYAGHSWASGTSPFTDGNNQESTSEAINAWTGVALWAEQIDNSALALEASWMLSNEYATAQRYWLLHDADRPDYLKSYQSPVASLVWGGKREYTTFFSDEPNAKLAIQLLPLTPTLQRASLDLKKDQFKGTSTDEMYGDQILMATPGSTLSQAEQLPDIAIDDGNSRTYLYSYIATSRQ